MLGRFPETDLRTPFPQVDQNMVQGLLSMLFIAVPHNTEVLVHSEAAEGPDAPPDGARDRMGMVALLAGVGQVALHRLGEVLAAGREVEDDVDLPCS